MGDLMPNLMPRLLSTALAAGMLVLTSAVPPASALARGQAQASDGQSLDGQSASTQTLFHAVWGDQAPARWIEEHNAELARLGAGAAVTGDPAIAKQEAQCAAALPSAPWFKTLVRDFNSDTEHTGLFPCAQFAGSMTGPNRVEASQSSTVYETPVQHGNAQSQ
jgi:hypothetical protein